MTANAAATSPWSTNKPTALLVLADGTVIEGTGIGATGKVAGVPDEGIHQVIERVVAGPLEVTGGHGPVAIGKRGELGNGDIDARLEMFGLHGTPGW